MPTSKFKFLIKEDTVTCEFLVKKKNWNKLLHWNVFTSTFHRLFCKTETKRTMQRLLFQLFYLTTGAISCSKLNYSGVKLMKPPLILIPPKVVDIPKNADIWTNFYYATLLNSHFCMGDLL